MRGCVEAWTQRCSVNIVVLFETGTGLTVPSACVVFGPCLAVGDLLMVAW